MHIPDEDNMAECPTCGAIIPLDAPSCPECGEVFAEDYEEVPVEEAPAAAPVAEDFGASMIEEEPIMEEPIGPLPEEEPGLTDEDIEPGLAGDVDDLEKKPSMLFWLGLLLIAAGFFGGPVLSYLHDALKIPIGTFTAYYVFGWVNWIVTIVGTVTLVIGILLLIIGWRRIKKWREALEEPLEEMGAENEDELYDEDMDNIEPAM